MKGIYRGDDLESSGLFSVFALMLMYMCCCCPSQWEELGQSSLFGIIACFCGLWSILCLYVAGSTFRSTVSTVQICPTPSLFL